MNDTNHQWLLARTPGGGWPEDGDFAWVEAPVPEPAEGQALTETIYLSLDPYQWGRRRNGVEQPGDVCHGRTVSRVVRSRHETFRDGDYVFNTNGWQEAGLTGRDIGIFNYMRPRRLDPAQAPISTAIGILGMLGLTAWSGLIVQCDPQPGETVVVSAASGGVGQVVGQLARIRGCRVIGIAGAEHKCRYLTDDLAFDAAVSHLSPTFAADLAAACPDGVDVYFENVGGAVFEAVLPLFNRAARISLCGMISQYGATDGRDAGAVWRDTGAATFERQAMTVHGLFVGNFVADYEDRFLAEMSGYIQDGRMHYREDVWQGLTEAPAAFSAMLAGRNFGKTLVAVADDPTLTGTTAEQRAAGDILGGAS